MSLELLVHGVGKTGLHSQFNSLHQTLSVYNKCIPPLYPRGYTDIQTECWVSAAGKVSKEHYQERYKCLQFFSRHKREGRREGKREREGGREGEGKREGGRGKEGGREGGREGYTHHPFIVYQCVCQTLQF